MFLKKVLNQPNLVGTVMIVLLFGAGFVYAFAFDGFNVETATGGEVEAWLAQAGGGGSGSGGGAVCTCGNAYCSAEVSVWKDGKEKKVTKHGCKSDNKCSGQTRKYPCPASANCRGKGGGAHRCTNQGCEKMPKPTGQPGKIDVCINSPKKSCKGGSSKC